ncbi:anhydro-N-acetylmuramic acid kinase [Aeoliella sp. SH292]|uniref:anhydro-N-acetylmuramic acid kinase n=1 Tax=Aeoliella sp. SH292 TaxID=3454464 RepID=UPI003F9625A9
MAQKKLYKSIGLMSGTSADGVDAALVVTDGEVNIEFHGGLTLPYDESLRGLLLEASQHNLPTTELLRLEKQMTLHHGEAVNALVEHLGKPAEGADVIGFHGHTVRHLPNEDITLQIGNPWLLNEATGIPVVFDFRRRDMALGGQGAPLVSMFHQAVFAKEGRPTLVLNLGGVANITWLGDKDEIIAGDTGPGCGLLDEWVQEMANMNHDVDGQLASKGQVHQDLVDEALDREFFRRSLPKSADRFDFDHVDVSGLSVEDGAATLCAVTVQAVVRAVAMMPKSPVTVWVTGGGVHHPVIMSQLAAHFPSVKSVDELGFNPDTLEAECFAWLAVRHLRKLPLSMPQTTGCREAATGGAYFG